uniref:Small ribosomal subunit protein bS16c n=1 Tax=Toxarium undulatum TaxID=210620 RepID=A0A1D8DC90_9STRA|nr:ribosomal protein S16 [Toxarium undulatum]YP_009308946.1 ribosomal protein S16 [Toxarium undulatum]AOS86633.1 ribosomal protein S16 [Toxarium undulatum]AOS86689.1 ribosomal protein S16 [Toxarium undulatum]
MLKLRLKKIGRKRQPFYRLVIMENTNKRDGRSIDEVGYYDILTKKLVLNKSKTEKWLNIGVKPTRTALTLLTKSEKSIIDLIK